MENNLKKAKELIKETNAVFAYVSEEKTLCSDQKGIGFVANLCNQGQDLSYGCVADKIVGKAAALLFVYLGVRCVYAETLSNSAKDVFERYGVEYSFGTLTDMIVNRKGDGPCPMEKAVIDADTPEAALCAVNETLEMLRNGR